jgi:hypothetical protein
MTSDGQMLPIDEIFERGLELKSVEALQPLLLKTASEMLLNAKG